MFVTDGGGYGGRESLLFKLTAGRGSANPATARAAVCAAMAAASAGGQRGNRFPIRAVI